MRRFVRLTITAVAATLAAGGVPTNAVAADPFGEHAAMCAQQLGQRADVPTVTCTHDGMTMTFATFGAMVEHMQTIH